MYSLEYLKEFFKNDLFAIKLLGAEILEAHDDYAKCSFKITRNHQNAIEIVMGGAIFTLADFTFAVATNQHEEYNTVSTTANISFLNPGRGEILYAEAIKIRDGKTVCFYDVNVYNEKNILIAKVNISGTHIKK
jgi:acyl-CoA thioesterase